MSIINIKKNKSNLININPFPFLNDNNLSFKAKGILITLLCFPNSWFANIKDIIACSKEKNNSFMLGLKELIDNGYCTQIESTISTKKRKHYNYVLTEKANICIDKNTLDIFINKNESLINDAFINYIKENKKMIYPLLNIEEKKKKKKKKIFSHDNEFYKIAELFFNKIQEQKPLIDNPDLNEWASAFAGLQFREFTTIEEIKFTIEFAFQNNFWKYALENPYMLINKFKMIKAQAYQKKEKNKSIFDEAREDGYT